MVGKAVAQLPKVAALNNATKNTQMNQAEGQPQNNHDTVRESIEAPHAPTKTSSGAGKADAPNAAMFIVDNTLADYKYGYPTASMLQDCSREQMLAAMRRLLDAINEAIAATDPKSVTGPKALEAEKGLPYGEGRESFEEWWKRQSDRRIERNDEQLVGFLAAQNFVQWCTVVENGTRIVERFPYPFKMGGAQECAVM